MKKILIFVLLFSLAACSKNCGKSSTSLNSNQKLEALDVFPDKHKLLFKLNWKKFSESPYYSNISKKFPEDLAQFSEQLETLYLSSAIRKTGEEASSLALIEGNFDQQKIIQWLNEASQAKNKELEKSSWNGKEFYISPNDPDIGMTILGNHQILWGTLSALKTSLASIENHKGNLRQDDSFVKLWKEGQDQLENHFLWGAASLLSSVPNDSALPMLQGVNTLLFSANLDKQDLNLFVQANTKSAEEAKSLQSFIEFSQNGFSSQLDPLTKQILSQLVLTQNEQKLSLQLPVTAKQIESLFAQNALNSPVKPKK